MKIIIGADIVPTSKNEKLFLDGDVETIVGSPLLQILNGADLRIFDLETPLCDKGSPISKQGPSLKAPKGCIRGIAALSPSLLTLANNHLMDQGEAGYRETIDALEQAGIRYVGCGERIDQAISTAILECQGYRIGVYACAEHEFSIAEKDRCGAVPYDPLICFDEVAMLKEQTDYVIVLYHGGKEYYRYPTPQLQARLRKFISKGADLVISQHTHCVGCHESYLDGTIVYGQGNFIFNKRSDEFWDTSLLIEVEIIDGKKSIKYIPIARTENGTSMTVSPVSDDILQGFEERSEQIKAEGFIAEGFRSFTQKEREGLLKRIHCPGFLFKVLDRITQRRFGKWYYSKRYIPKHGNMILNTIECEAWREMLIDTIRSSDAR